MFTVSLAEAGRYAGGCKDTALLEECASLLYSIAEPRTVFRVFPHEDIKDILVGNDINRHLSGCESVICMAATLGYAVDRKTEILQRTAPEKALVLHGCACAAIESVCDELEATLIASFDKKFLTGRFSPGYGDLPLEIQNAFCLLLDAERRIGVTVDENCFMHPVKSVTAFIGVSASPVKRMDSCAYCKCFASCHGKNKGACKTEMIK